MIIAPFPFNETERQENLNSYQVLDTPAEDDFDSIVRLASQICNTPISLVTLLDKDRQWFKAKTGIDIDSSPRDFALCSHAILNKEIMVVEDLLEDERFHDNPFAKDGVRFYAGVPIVSPEGFNLGTVCIADHVPRSLTEEQYNSLRELSKIATRMLELKRKNQLIRKNAEEFILLKSQAIQSYMSENEKSKKQTAVSLHEDYAQNIASALMLLQIAEKKSGDSKEMLGDIRNLLSQSLHDIKTQALRMSPTILLDFKSQDMIREYFKQLAPTYPFSMRVETHLSNVVLEEGLLLTIIRITQNWLNVLALHKAVTEVSIYVFCDDIFHLEIADNDASAVQAERELLLNKNLLLDDFHAAGGEVRLLTKAPKNNTLQLSAPVLKNDHVPVD